MSQSTTKTRLTGLALLALLGISFAGCATADSGADQAANGSSEEASATAEQPADLIGEWVQTNSSDADSYQAATISADAIEINWISEADDTKALYWAGTFVAPTAAGPFEWTSENDTTKTSGAMLASVTQGGM